jgi:hypothetical protein
MSNGPEDDAVKRRALRRRHLHERQAVIFGTLITALAAAGLLGLGVWFGAIPTPFDVPFHTASPSQPFVAQPCPPADATPVAYEDITVTVYNGTTRVGLAADTASELSARGLGIAGTDNDPEGAYSGFTLVRAGTPGLAQAYTVAAIFPGAVVSLDDREDSTIDVTLGSEYDGMSTPEEAALDPETPLAAPEGCFDPESPPTGDETPSDSA